jgi:hypothetical protein
MNVAEKTTRKPYAKPVLQKRRRLTDVTEASDTLITGGTLPKGGCFSNNR